MRVNPKSAAGVTLVEVLVGAIIISLMSIVIVRMTATASAGISRAADESVAAQTAMRLARLVRYDIAGSDDLVIHGSTAPAAGMSVCASNLTRWSYATTTPFVRGLFTVRVRDVDDSFSPNDSSRPAWQKGTRKWVGYEIRRAGEVGDLVPFELWRVECADSGGIPAAFSPTTGVQERVVVLGVPSDAANASSANGSTVISCKTADCTSFAIRIPYSGKRAVLRDETSVLLGDVKRRIDS